jgi:hypothetical protein
MKYTLIFFFYLVFTLFISGCKDESNPVEQEEHFEPEGLVFVNESDATVLVVWQAEVQNTWNNQSIPDKFSTTSNDSTGIIKLKFLNSSKEIMDYPEDEEYSFGSELQQSGIAQINHLSSDKWSFRIIGLSPGTASAEFRVLHGGHADVKTPLINIEIN